MKPYSVLSNGTRLETLKRAANILRCVESIPISQALDRIAAAQGFADWQNLANRAWSLDDDGDIQSFGIMPGSEQTVMIFSPLIRVDKTLDLDWNWEVKVSVRLTSDTRAPYLYVNFASETGGAGFDLDDASHEAFEHAIETGRRSDAIAAQGTLVEHTLAWFPRDWLDGASYNLVTELERRRRGISDDDLVWQEPGLAGYGPDQHAVRVYRAADDKLLVCYEAESEPSEHDDARIKPFGLITRAQFAAVPIDPCNGAAAHRALLEAACMV